MPENSDRKRSAEKKRPIRGEKKRQYLEHARKLFSQFGYAATSFEQIADSAGVTRAVLVKSFHDKTVFLRAIGDDWLEFLFPPTPAEDSTPADVITRLQSLTERFLQSLRKDQQTARIVLAGLAEHVEEEESGILRGILESATDRLAPIIHEGQQAGVIRRGLDARQMAADWLRFMLGAALLPPTETKVGETHPSIIETLLHGVLKTDV